jgi:Protein of unknown function (DUF3995)
MPAPSGTRLAGRAACAWALAFAVPSLYWGLGGEAGIGSIAAQPEEIAGVSDDGIVLATAGIKVLAGIAVLALVEGWLRDRAHAALRIAVRVAGVLLILYGAAEVVDHLLMVTGAIDTPPELGSTAAAWHLALWDPYFILGGALFWIASAKSE